MVASILQIGISGNVKCDIMVGFPKSGHIYCCYNVSEELPEVS